MDAEHEDAEHWNAVEHAVDLLHEQCFREALECLRDVLSKNDKNPYAFFFLGQGFYEVGEIEPARDAYCACLKLAPRHLGARVALCHVLRKLGDCRNAIKQGMIALEQAPADSDALYAVGLAYLARGDDPAARRYLEAFLKTKPEFEVRLEVEALIARIT